MSWIGLAVLTCFVLVALRHRRGWDHPHRSRRVGRAGAADARIRAFESALASRDEAISLLETRVAELEARADFMERLLESHSAARS